MWLFVGENVVFAITLVKCVKPLFYKWCEFQVREKVAKRKESQRAGDKESKRIDHEMKRRRSEDDGKPVAKYRHREYGEYHFHFSRDLMITLSG